MANAGIKYNITLGKSIEKYGTAWENSLDFLGHSECMTSLAKGYRYYINRKVPKLSGELRRSARVIGVAHGAHGSTGMAVVTWNSAKSSVQKYLHYQYVGEVWGPNKAVFDEAGKHIGWHSPIKPKSPTGRMMGVPFTRVLHDGRVIEVKGYTTPGTGPDWVKRFAEDSGDYGEKAINILAGRYFYDWFCKVSKGTPCETKHYGSWVAYNRWRQIENIKD